MEQLELISNKRLLIRIVTFALAGVILIGLAFSYYLRELALNTLARLDAKNNSEFIFDVLYAEMNEGSKQSEITDIISRMEQKRPGMNIRSHPSPLIQELYGTKSDIKASPIHDKISDTFQSAEHYLSTHNGVIRHLMPVIFNPSCLQCHTNAAAGDVAGIIEFAYPSKEIMTALDKLVYLFLFFMLMFLIAVFYTIYYILNRNILTPLIEFITQIGTIKNAKDLKRKIHIRSNLHEIKSLEFSFNELGENLRYYYDKMIKQSYVDPLTGLPNLIRLSLDLEQCSSTTPSLVIFNIDGFKSINDFYGYKTGNALLLGLKDKLETLKNPQQRLYRVSGSEFAILQQTHFDFPQIMEMLEQVNSATYKVDGAEMLLSVTAGFANEHEKLFEKATAALNEAKANHKPIECYYDSIHKHEEYVENAQWTSRIKDAIENDRIITYYQPIYCTANKNITKYETLVRLKDRDGKVYSPIHFLEVSKRSRHYLQISRIVFKKAFEYFKQKKNIEFSINISYEDIADTQTCTYIKILLEQFPEPERVIFELLESEQIRHFETVNTFIKDVKAMGARIAIDDFGSGYSNFAYLAQMEADFIKIDSSLIKNMVHDRNAYVIVKTIAAFARELGIKTVAEFVANEHIYKSASELELDFLQGYYFGKPDEKILLNGQRDFSFLAR